MSQVLSPAWEWLDRPGLEVASVCVDDDAVTMTGVVVTTLQDAPIRLRYSVALLADWTFHHAALEVAAADGTRSTTIERDGDAWTVDGQARGDLAVCTDIDIMASPSTNTLPIRRLAWAPGESRVLHMAYIRLADLTVTAVAQRYTRLPDATSDEPASGHRPPAPSGRATAPDQRFEYQHSSPGSAPSCASTSRGWCWTIRRTGDGCDERRAPVSASIHRGRGRR